ncbi:MAG: hypothetical protein M3T56_06070, partial [Chloroflexota bacterium]|nr:hypothetical protein [Chloroflexota bacterium]
MLQHTDSKAQQQRLLCLGEHAKDEAASTCQQPFMMINDLGLTFGRANTFNRDVPGSVDLQAWAHVPVWASAKQCIGNLPKSWTGSLDYPLISEAGRRFLGGLLAQLTDSQIHDLFDAARFPLRIRANRPRSTSVDDWVSAFKNKRDQILNRSCPS